MILKQRKTILPVVLALVVSVFFSSCGNSESDPENLINPAESFDKSATIEETVLFDNDEIKITAKSLTYRGYSIDINLLIENSSDNDISVLSNTVICSGNSVNSHMIQDGYLNCDVPTGSQAEDTMSFSIQELVLRNIKAVAELDLSFYIDFDDYKIKDIYTDPVKLTTSLYNSYDYSEEGFEKSLKNKNLKNWYNFSVDKENKDKLTLTDTIEVTYQVLFTNKDGNKMMIVDVANNSRSPIDVYIKNMYINGLRIADNVDHGNIKSEKHYASALQIGSLLDAERMKILGIKNISKVKYTIAAETSNGELITQKDIEFDVSKKWSFNASGEVAFDQNDITVIYKGAIPSDSEYSKYTYALFLVKNNSSKRVYVADLRLSYANNVSVKTITYGAYVEPNEYTFIESKITDIDNLSTLKMSFKVTDDDNNIVAEPLIDINCQ